MKLKNRTRPRVQSMACFRGCYGGCARYELRKGDRRVALLGKAQGVKAVRLGRWPKLAWLSAAHVQNRALFQHTYWTERRLSRL
jgi:hypothetical protein